MKELPVNVFVINIDVFCRFVGDRGNPVKTRFLYSAIRLRNLGKISINFAVLRLAQNRLVASVIPKEPWELLIFSLLFGVRKTTFGLFSQRLR